MSLGRIRSGDTPDVRRLVSLTGALIAVELCLLVGYYAVSSQSVLSPRYVLYPFVWINSAVLALLVVDWPRVRGFRRLVATTVAVAYFLVLTWLDGSVASGMGTGTLRVVSLPPGWGPALLYDGVVRLSLFPFKLVGYAALAALVYALVADTTGRTALGGALGLFTCVSCTLPIAAAALSGVVGGTVGLTAVATASLSYDLSTLAYVVSVGLLTWRPAT